MIATMLLGAALALSAIGSLVAAGVLGFRRGVDVGIEKGWQEAVQEDADFDAEWGEYPDGGNGLGPLLRGRAPIRRLQ